MKAYAMICKDEKEQVSYYFDMDTNKLYSDRHRNKNLDPNRWTFLGGIVGVFLNGIIGKYAIEFSNFNPYFYFIPVVLGVLLAIPMVKLSITSTESNFFNNENFIDSSFDSLKALYKQGAKFRLKLISILTLLLVFNIWITAYISSQTKNIWMYFIVLLLWFGITYIFLGYRPIYLSKFKRLMRTGTLNMK